MRVRVRIYPDKKKEVVTEVGEHNFEMKLKAPAERNLANKRMRELISEWYNVKVGKVKIITGHHSPHKIVEVLLD